MEDTNVAYAAALEQEKKAISGDASEKLGRMLSPNELNVHQTATMDMPPDYEEIMESVLPGQTVVGNGSTIYNPNRSDPRVEKIWGEKRYKVKTPDNSPELMKNTIIELTNKVNMLSSMVAGNPAPEPVKTKEQEAEQAQGGITEAELNARSYQNVVAIAKSLGLRPARNIKKDDCIKLILNDKAR